MVRLFIFISINFLFIHLTFAQEKKIIEIQKAGSSNQNEKLEKLLKKTDRSDPGEHGTNTHETSGNFCSLMRFSYCLFT